MSRVGDTVSMIVARGVNTSSPLMMTDVLSLVRDSPECFHTWIFRDLLI